MTPAESATEPADEKERPADAEQRSKNPHAIARINVEGLFGQYDYDLSAKAGSHADLSRLFIMYGENGAGKTTRAGALRIPANLMVFRSRRLDFPSFS